MRVPAAGLFAAFFALLLGLAFVAGGLAASEGDVVAEEGLLCLEEFEAEGNPCLGDPEAIKKGGRLFRARCTGCHWNPLRGPRIFQTERTYEYFLEVTINGRKTLRTMPPFGNLLSPDDVSMIHAYLMSRERP